MAIDNKKFDKDIITFLDKQNNKFGDISHIANSFINGQKENKQEVHRRLMYLKRDRDIIYIKDIDDIVNDPMQPISDWWGNIETVKVERGEIIEDLYAKLSKNYLETVSERNHSFRREIKIAVVTALLSIIVGIILFLLQNQSQTQKDEQQDNELNQMRNEITNIQNQMKDLTDISTNHKR